MKWWLVYAFCIYTTIDGNASFLYMYKDTQHMQWCSLSLHEEWLIFVSVCSRQLNYASYISHCDCWCQPLQCSKGWEQNTCTRMKISFESLFYNNFQVEWFFCTEENTLFSLKDLFLVYRKQNLKTLPKITQIKEISAWVSNFLRHTLIPVQNDSILSSFTGSTLPISSKYQNR